jgi:hypothetical protein
VLITNLGLNVRPSLANYGAVVFWRAAVAIVKEDLALVTGSLKSMNHPEHRGVSTGSQRWGGTYPANAKLRA